MSSHRVVSSSRRLNGMPKRAQHTLSGKPADTSGFVNLNARFCSYAFVRVEMVAGQVLAGTSGCGLAERFLQTSSWQHWGIRLDSIKVQIRHSGTPTASCAFKRRALLKQQIRLIKYDGVPRLVPMHSKVKLIVCHLHPSLCVVQHCCAA